MPAFRAIQVLRRSPVLRANMYFLTVPTSHLPQSQHPGWCISGTPRVTVYPCTCICFSQLLTVHLNNVHRTFRGGAFY